MKNFTFSFLCSFLLVFNLVPQKTIAQQGFTAITNLNNLPTGIDTRGKPQAKVWKYAGKWWSVLSGDAGTSLFRLDGVNWTFVLKFTSIDSRADYWIVDNVVHVLLFRQANFESYLYSLEYDSASDTYKPWNERQARVTMRFPEGAEIASMTLDGAGRMWVAAAGVSEVYAWWSDAPYSIWSAPVTIATGVKDDDICAITRLPGKIGVLWSNQNTKRFGFKTHSDDSSPTSWSVDEKPAAQSALDNVGSGMADNHMNIVVASDGTLYSAVKTNYNTIGYPQVVLLVRRPSGSWDNLYKVTTHAEGGTQPIVLLNEALGRVKVVYTTLTNGGYIAYRESATSAISFGATKILINSGGLVYNFATSTHQAYNPEVVILATKVNTSPSQVVSILAKDSVSVSTEPRQSMQSSIAAFPNPFSNNTTLSYIASHAGPYTISLYDNKGIRVAILQQGVAEVGDSYTFNVNGNSLNPGLYFVSVKTGKSTETIKLLFNR